MAQIQAIHRYSSLDGAHPPASETAIVDRIDAVLLHNDYVIAPVCDPPDLSLASHFFKTLVLLVLFPTLAFLLNTSTFGIESDCQ